MINSSKGIVMNWKKLIDVIMNVVVFGCGIVACIISFYVRNVWLFIAGMLLIHLVWLWKLEIKLDSIKKILKHGWE